MNSKIRLAIIMFLGVAAIAAAFICKPKSKPGLLPSQVAKFKQAVSDKNIYLIETQLSHCSAKELARYKPYVNVRDSAGNTPLHIAAISGSKKAANLLLKAGAKVDCCNRAGRTPLLASVGAYADPNAGLVEDVLKFEIYNERADMVCWLLKAGVNVNAQDENGDTSLLLALRAAEHWKSVSYKGEKAPVAADYDQVVKVLLKSGANVSIANKKGETPLRIAYEYKDREYSELLHKHGAR